MKSIRPETSDPIPLRPPPPRMFTIMVRFAARLTLAVIVLAFAWR